jgi:hypothetical protein
MDHSFLWLGSQLLDLPKWSGKLGSAWPSRLRCLASRAPEPSRRFGGFQLKERLSSSIVKGISSATPLAGGGRTRVFPLSRSSLPPEEFFRGALYELLSNPIFVGEIRHRIIRHRGLHDPSAELRATTSLARLLRDCVLETLDGREVYSRRNCFTDARVDA